jgi:phosphate transport system substrate-binding protein
MKIFAVLLIALFVSCTSHNDTIKIKGSDTEVNVAVSLAEQFHKKNAAVLVSVSGGGSGLGIASLFNGNTDIANSSRSIKASELDLLKSNNIAIDSFFFAQDAIAFIASDKIQIDSISVISISGILSGKIKNWSSLAVSEMPITIYGRQSNSGTYDYVKHILGIHFSPYAKQMNGNAQIIDAIKSDSSGFGYVSAGYVLNGNADGLKVLTVYNGKSKAISPLDSNAIVSGTYFFQRPLFQYYRKAEFHKINSFLEFERSTAGARIIQKAGYYPIRQYR